MFRNQLKSTLRKLVKDKRYTIINVVGLSTGLLLFLMVTLYVQRELNTDKHQQNYFKTFRVNTAITNTEGLTENYALSYLPLAEALNQDIAGIKQATNFFSPAAQLSFRSGNELLSVENNQIYYTDNSFFQVFSHQWVDEGTKLSEPNTAVISDRLAQRFFGKEEVIGEILTYQDPQQTLSLQITGVFKTQDNPSHIDYDLLINNQSQINFWKSGLANNWGVLYVYTYFTTNELIDRTSLNASLNGIKVKYKPESESLKFEVQPLNEIYFNPVNNEPGINGNMNYVFIFLTFGLVVLVLAAVNFINLMTARSIRSGKEVAIRKVVGAQKSGLIFQFLMESTGIALISMFLACVSLERLVPAINSNLNLELHFSPFSNIPLLVLVVFMPLLIGVVSGIYPAFVLSSYKASALLRGKPRWSLTGEGLRKGLILFQFFISVLVLSGVAIINQQLNYVRVEGLGFKENPIIVLPRIASSSNILLGEALESNPDVLGFSSVSGVPGYRTPLQRRFKEANTAGEGTLINGLWVGQQYADIMELEFLSGRNFRNLDQENTMILNEKAVQALGLKASEVLGKQIVLTGRNGFDPATYEVVGVTKDYHYGSLYDLVEPLFLMNDSKSTIGGKASIVEISKANFDQTVAELGQIWAEIEKNEGFDYYFLHDAMNEIYAKEIKLSKVIVYASVVSAIICFMGLLGLVTLTLESRKKEIGIRKVLGATGISIAGLLSSTYSRIIGLSVLIGLPVSYILLNKWLESFAYRVNYSFGLYIIIGLGVLLLSITLIGAQTLRASRLNPVQSLRDE